MSLKMLEKYSCECSCEKCVYMCHLPCVASVEETRKLIEAGYGDRLTVREMYDGTVLKPALKGEERTHMISPIRLMSNEGCTFFKDGKCELHDTGLKPIMGRIAHHDMDEKLRDEIRDQFDEEWRSQEASDLIEEYIEEFKPEVIDYTDYDFTLIPF